MIAGGGDGFDGAELENLRAAAAAAIGFDLTVAALGRQVAPAAVARWYSASRMRAACVAFMPIVWWPAARFVTVV